MLALARLAIRNLVQHKGKTLIVGTIIALGVALLVVGSSVLGSGAQSLRRSFTASFTGEVVITGKAQGNVTLFGSSESGSADTIPTLSGHDRITAYLAGRPEVKGFTSQVNGAQQLNKVGEDVGGGGPFVYLFGIDAATWPSTFNNLTLVSGALLAPWQEGILLSTRQLEEFKTELGTDLNVGDKVLIQSFGNAIRQVTLRGVFSFKESNAATDLICYIDPQTLRDLLGMASASDAVAAADATETSLLSTSEESLFQGGGQIVRASARARLPAKVPEITRSPAAASGQAPGAAAGDGGPWHFVLVNLKNPGEAASFIAATNRWLADEGIAARAEDWRTAAGPFAIFPSLISVVFGLAIAVIAIVAVIIIMNTLVVSIGERTGEIGTMRALGAQKGFIWRMLFLETLVISLLFGAAGMAVGSAAVGVLNVTGVRSSGMLLQMIAGASTLRPTVVPSSLGTSLLLVILVALVAHLYPVRTALRIQPIVAIQSRSE